MKKYIISACVLGLLAVSCSVDSCYAATAASKLMKADVQAIRIPAGTTMELEFMTIVSSVDGSVGDEFSAMLKEDKIVNGQIALPAGSVIRGTISRLEPSKRLSRCAKLYLSFDHVVDPTGRQIPLSAGMYNYAELTIDGGIYKGGNYGYALKQNWKNTKNLFNKTVNWGKGTGDNMQYVCVPLGAVGGVFGGAAYYVGDSVADLFRKGENVTLEQGQTFEVMLTQPLDIPLH